MTTKFKDFSSMPRCTGLRSRLSYFSLRGWNFTKVSPIGNDKRVCRHQPNCRHPYKASLGISHLKVAPDASSLTSC
jgi:hypothetical protein